MVSQGDSMAEDMGLEEVRSVQTLIFQGGKAPSMFVPGVVPKICHLSNIFPDITYLLCEASLLY